MRRPMDKRVLEIVQAIVRIDPPKKIILFGSRARGDEIFDSDVDLAVLYERLDRNPYEVAQSLRMSLLDVTTLPIDLLIYEDGEFERRSRHSSSVESVIA
jgi:uncharacterized protein